jgi:hypothetical protein
MNIRVTVDLERKGDIKKLLERVLRNMGQEAKVKVGFPAGKSPSDIIAIATYNHEGTRGGASGGGWGGPIPPRPFITQALFKGRGELKQFMRAEARNILLGRITPKQALPRLGIWGQQQIQDQIRSNMRPKNSPVTVRLKGSDKTLIDSGRMLQSVTWAIE